MSKIIKSVAIGKKPVVITFPEPELPIETDLPAGADSDNGPDADTVVDTDTDNVAAGDDIIAKARLEADGIIGAARSQAETLLAETTERCANLKQDAYDQGRQQGYTQGLAQAQEAIDDASAKAQAIIAEAGRRAAETLRAAERQMVDISLAVARKILNREIAENPTVVLPLIKAALDKVHDQDQVTIRVSPVNLEPVRQAKTELQALLSGDGILNIVGDDGLKEGDCIIETPFGVVDARIDTQFEAIKSVLRDAGHELV